MQPIRPLYRRPSLLTLLGVAIWLATVAVAEAATVTGILPESELQAIPAGDAAHGKFSYEDFQTARQCKSCHVDIYQQWSQAMMSQAYVHHWDEIEYFELAVPHAERKPKVAGVKAGCNGCHAPLAFLAGDIPPKRPAENTRANEGVSCDLCHSITGFEGDVPFNYNFIVKPGDKKQGVRTGTESNSPADIVIGCDLLFKGGHIVSENKAPAVKYLLERCLYLIFYWFMLGLKVQHRYGIYINCSTVHIFHFRR